MASSLRRHALLLFTISSIFVGVLLRGLLRLADHLDVVIRVIGLPGLLFMNTLKLVILPMIAAAIISRLS